MVINQLHTVLNNVTKVIIRKLQQQLTINRGSGMPMNTTEILSKSIKASGDFGTMAEVEIVSEEYGVYLDKGIGNIPYTQGSGEKTSNYILGLKKWAMVKFGMSPKKALQMAFMVAKTQKNRGSAPAKPGWIEEIKDELDRKVDQTLHSQVFTAIQMDVNIILNRVI